MRAIQEGRLRQLERRAAVRVEERERQLQARRARGCSSC